MPVEINLIELAETCQIGSDGPQYYFIKIKKSRAHELVKKGYNQLNFNYNDLTNSLATHKTGHIT